LNQQEQRIIYALITIMDPTDDPSKMYRFAAKELAEMLDLQENIQESLSHILSGLLRKRVEISTAAKSTLDVSWIISFVFLEQEENRYVELEISNKLRPNLLGLKRKTIDK
jgi:hypothetical protein